jgi:AraC family transcriptional regulator
MAQTALSTLERMNIQHNREIELPCSGGLSTFLAYYGPGTHIGVHAHNHVQVSFLLSGEMLERHRDAEWRPPGFGVSTKPPGLMHEDFAGPSGMLIFTVGLEESSDAAVAASEPGWSVGQFDPAVTALVRAWLQAGTAQAREESAIDLLALKTPPAARRGAPPTGLEHARQAIMEEPDAITMAEAAEVAGLHRVRFSTLFREYYGLAPSLYRLRALTARAIRDIAGGTEELTDIAYRVGFSDQAHMTRSVQRTTGLSPGRLRSLFF